MLYNNIKTQFLTGKIFEQMDRQDETTRNYEEAINEAKSIKTLAPPALCRKKSNSLPDLARLHEQGLGHLLLVSTFKNAPSHDKTEVASNFELKSRARIFLVKEYSKSRSIISI